ncbi:META domain-containing protein [Methanoregula sp.]|uniref:META domain-containing protein n=1 Tax=Methanoregula sp. TaxID=2052170 RepID=UPI0026207F36|nr:META domain-containing protein [Methanoregula sp.]MDD5143989.1 META domain-containing protein [Methanoregula sp.]
MPDSPEPSGDSRETTSPADTPKGYMISLAVVLMGILIVMVFFMNLSGQEATASTAITQQRWSLQSYAGPDGTTVPVQDGTTVTALFTTEGKVSGSGGCNQYSARYLVRETTMIVSGITTTKMNCPGGGVMIQESRYYSLLEQAASPRVHNRVLTLYSTEGKPLLVFVSA